MEAARRNILIYRIFAAVSFTPFMLPVIVLFWQENGMDMYQVYLLQGLFAVAVVLLELPTGMVADRMGKRTSLAASAVIGTFGMVIYALGGGFLSFLVAESLLALALALLSGADAALLYDSLATIDRTHDFRKFEGEAQGIRMISNGICALAGGFIGAVSLRASVWATVFGPAISIPIAFCFTEQQKPKAAKDLREAAGLYRSLIADSWRFVRKHRLVRWQIACLALLSGSSTWLLWLYQPYMSFCGVPVWLFGFAFALFNIVSAAASHRAAWFDGLFGRTGTLAAMLSIETLPPILMALIVKPASILFVLGHQAVRGLARPIISQRIMHYTFADKRATVLSFASLSGRLFFAVTSPLVGLVTRHAGIRPSLLVQGGTIAFLAAVLLWRYRAIPEKYFLVKESVVNRQ